MALCKIAIIGNLGGDPETRYTPSGTRVLSFSVAVNRFRTGPDGQRQEETEWFRVSAFGRTAEIYEPLLSKGKRVYVDGRFSSRQWQSNQDGQMRTSLEIAAQDIFLLEARVRDDMGAEGGVGTEPIPISRPPASSGGSPSQESGDIDDLPF